jgi:hypothetical protein
VIYQPIRRADLLTAASIPHLNHHDVLRMVKDQEGIEGEILSATGLHGLDNAVRFISIRKHGPIAAAAGPGAYFSSSGAGWATSSCFPGGYIPALSEVTPAIERSGLLVCDIEILRLHYAETLRAWRERFMARREEAVRLYDERFARMWEFYLAASEMSFRKQNLMNFQIQLTKRQDVVPMTRDYIVREEARLRARERGSQAQLKMAGE